MRDSKRVIVIGAGAWGLPAATELQRRGHRVLLIDRHGVGSRYSSSTGPTRIWRLAHPDVPRTRLAVAAAAAFERVARDSGRQVHTRRGLLWRDGGASGALDSIRTAASQVGVEFTDVAAADVGAFFPGLRPDDRDAIWQPNAGTVLAEVYLRAQYGLFQAAGGQYREGVEVTDLQATENGVRVSSSTADGFPQDADAVVLAAGSAMREWLPALGVDVALRAVLEQVVHVGGPAAVGPAHTDSWPCLIDGAIEDEPGIYAMPTPGLGYKLGHSNGTRELAAGDLDRAPDPRLSALAAGRLSRMLEPFGQGSATVLDAAVCPWTLSPDNRFIIDTLPDLPGVVVAAGCGGEGFKFSALMGQILADRVEDRDLDADVAGFSLDRFADGSGRTPASEHGFGV